MYYGVSFWNAVDSAKLIKENYKLFIKTSSYTCIFLDIIICILKVCRQGKEILNTGKENNE